MASRSHLGRLVDASIVLAAALPFNPAPAWAAGSATSATAVPADTYTPYVTEAARRFNLPEAWIWAVMRAESRGNPRAISPAGALGLMQIMPATWTGLTARYGLGNDPFEARANILAGAAYLREMLDRYGDLGAALAAYNAGPGRVDDWRAGARPLPKVTLVYVSGITSAVSASPGTSAATATVAPPDWHSAGLFIERDTGAPTTSTAAPTKPPAALIAGAPDAGPATSSAPTETLFIPLAARIAR